ncbi:MAG: hypothetical protein HRT74_10515 [Flavobacteriales bacterium]|nr:hypothetical protein [Flavobacteriales bacterium]
MRQVYLLIALLGFSSFATAMEHTFDKEYHRSYPANSSTSLEIENKYGDVEFIAWDKDSVNIDVKVTVITDDFSESMELRDAILIDFQNAGSFIVAETTWSEELSFFKKKLIGIGQTFSGNDRIQVSYTVHCPTYISIDLINKFGNVYLGNHQGDFSLRLSHGDLRARNIEKNNRCEVDYGKVKISSIKGGKCDFSFLTNSRIDYANNVRIKSSGSEIYIEEGRSLELDSRHDDYTITRANDIKVTANLTDITVEEVDESIQMSMRFGSAYIERLIEDCESVSLDGMNTDITVKFSPGWQGKYRAELTNSKGHHFVLADHKPDGMTVQDKTETHFGIVNGGDQMKLMVTMRGGFLTFGE